VNQVALVVHEGKLAALRGRHIVVRGQRPLRREADGEPLADGRVLDVKVAPGALLLRLKEPLSR
jgi:hypothetical protein